MTEVVIQSAPTGPDAPVISTRPGNVPEKFWDAEAGTIRQDDLLKSYSELERQFHGDRQQVDDNGADGSEQPSNDGAGDADAEGAEGSDREAAEEQLGQRGLDLSKFEQEFADSGELSENSLAELEKSGIPKPMVDAYIAGQQAIAAQYDQSVYSTAGGEQTYQEMLQWAAENFTEAEVKIYDTAIKSGDLEAAKSAVKGLQARFGDAEGYTPTLVSGQRQGSRAAGYGNTAEMERDMNDIRYRNGEPAFHAHVDRRIAATKAF